MELLLNERKYAEEILDQGIVDKKPSATVQLLVRYFWHVSGYRKKLILQQIDEFMLKNYAGYNPDEWYDVVCKYINNAKKYPLLEVDTIYISDSELDAIQSLCDDQAERLMFTCLCLAKQYNAARPENSNWVNVDWVKLFKLANMNGDKKSKLLKIHYLKNSEQISLSLKCSNTNIRVEIISDGKDYPITNLVDLGNQYMVLSGKGFFCNVCGKYEKFPKQKIKSKSFIKPKICKQCSQLTHPSTKYIVCIDCGKLFETSVKDTRSERCSECYAEQRKNYYAKQKANQRDNAKNVHRPENDKIE